MRFDGSKVIDISSNMESKWIMNYFKYFWFSYLIFIAYFHIFSRRQSSVAKTARIYFAVRRSLMETKTFYAQFLRFLSCCLFRPIPLLPRTDSSSHTLYCTIMKALNNFQLVWMFIWRTLLVCGCWCGSICCSRIWKVCHILLIPSIVRVRNFWKKIGIGEKVIFFIDKIPFWTFISMKSNGSSLKVNKAKLANL